MDYTVVDLETNGNKSFTDRIFDIGLYQTDGVHIAQNFSSYINPHQPIPIFIKRMTKVNLEDLKLHPDFETLAPSLISFFNDKVFVAHHVDFDYDFIRESFKRCGIKFNCPKLCTLKLIKNLKPDLSKFNIGFLASCYGMDTKQRHKAIFDAEVATMVLHNLIKEFGKQTIDNFII